LYCTVASNTNHTEINNTDATNPPTAFVKPNQHWSAGQLGVFEDGHVLHSPSSAASPASLGSFFVDSSSSPTHAARTHRSNVSPANGALGSPRGSSCYGGGLGAVSHMRTSSMGSNPVMLLQRGVIPSVSADFHAGRLPMPLGTT